MLMSVSGPTKTGKTVLVNKVVGEDRLVSVSGSSISGAETLWERASAEVGLSGLPQSDIIELLRDDDRVLLIDDFHYVARDVQRLIAQQIKDAIARGLLVIVVSVPHRSDDAIRGNPDLRGRVMTIDLDYWERPELYQIADIGFPLLNLKLEDETKAWLAEQSLRAPQLMQHLCLEICRYLQVKRPQEGIQSVSLDKSELSDIAQHVALYTESKSIFQVLQQGPHVRGTERTIHRFKGGPQGDVYELVLHALWQDPPILSFPMPVLRERVSSVLLHGGTVGASLQNAVRNMAKLNQERMPDQRVIEWDEERQTLDILDPYFAYYMRWGPPSQAEDV